MTLDLDDALVAALMVRMPGASVTHAIEEAVRDYLTHDSVAKVRELAGTLDIEDVSKGIRKTDRTS